MSDLEAIGWKPHATKEGVYMRPTEGIERLVTFLVGVGAPPILSSVVSVTTSIFDLEAVLKRAWVKLRNANASLASYVNWEDGEEYLWYDANDTKEWLEETVILKFERTHI